MILIGERINATRKSIKTAIQNQDTGTIQAEITRQDTAGATYIDLNAGTGAGDMDQEARDLCWLIDIALETTDKKLVLDAASPAVLKKAVEHLGERRAFMINSVKGDFSTTMKEIMDLAAGQEAPLIALAMDEDGIPSSTEKRLEICSAIRKEAQSRGIPDKHLFFDPLVLPISADISQGMVTFTTISGIKEMYPEAKTTMGLSNVSHGLKERLKINSTFLSIAIAYGLDSAICDPGKVSIRRAAVLGELIAGKDRHCRKFSRAYRGGLFND
ncbi:dihydropteroate synthase [Marispirochaeta sp.]|jgi:5-methyltetrahydrofolate corrinoid/iron sulfur protein methyltransferase|uniref:dihydropteroate synthase n=1 Tax=Marispirochaeta sp. TaxID=2038653 RepID=UPI0029C69096|nr:dihydropteroate synthase [Marispirochaeta sp.]